MAASDMSKVMSGELLYTIDSKGRMSFPPRFREIIGDRFILTKGLDKQITVRSEENWNSLVERISAMPEGRNKEYLKYQFIKCAVTVEADKLGRILIPQTLRTFAALTKDVYVVGSMDTAEIWDKSTYDLYAQKLSADDLYAALEALG